MQKRRKSRKRILSKSLNSTMKFFPVFFFCSKMNFNLDGFAFSFKLKTAIGLLFVGVMAERYVRVCVHCQCVCVWGDWLSDWVNPVRSTVLARCLYFVHCRGDCICALLHSYCLFDGTNGQPQCWCSDGRRSIQHIHSVPCVGENHYVSPALSTSRRDETPQIKINELFFMKLTTSDAVLVMTLCYD